MSTEPCGAEGNFVTHTYLNVKITRKDWCSYEGHCLVDRVITGYNDLCMLCKYRKPLDVPALLKKSRVEAIKRHEEFVKQLPEMEAKHTKEREKVVYSYTNKVE